MQFVCISWPLSLFHLFTKYSPLAENHLGYNDWNQLYFVALLWIKRNEEAEWEEKEMGFQEEEENDTISINFQIAEPGMAGVQCWEENILHFNFANKDL